MSAILGLAWPGLAWPRVLGAARSPCGPGSRPRPAAALALARPWPKSVPAPGLAVDAAALDRHCLAQMARCKRPKRYVFVDALAKNSYGKVLKRELRERLGAGG